MTTPTWQSQLEAASFPSQVVVLDFETYFNNEYSLKKLSGVEFVADPRFELTGLGYQTLGEGSTACGFLTPPEIGPYLAALAQHIDRYTIVAANARFDCLILRERFGITPSYVVDVQDLGRNLDARDRHDVDHMAKKYGAPTPKGDTMQFSGLHWVGMTPTQRKAMVDYCLTDVEIETHLFTTLLPRIVNPEVELRLSNQTLRLFLEPNIHVNFALGGRLAT